MESNALQRNSLQKNRQKSGIDCNVIAFVSGLRCTLSKTAVQQNPLQKFKIPTFGTVMYGPPKPRPKQKHPRTEPRKHRMPPLVFFTRFFRQNATLFEVFWIPPNGLAFVCFDILQYNGCQKIPKSSPFYIFPHCDTVQKSHFKIFFQKFFKISQKAPFNFFSYFARQFGPTLGFFGYCKRMLDTLKSFCHF